MNRFAQPIEERIGRGFRRLGIKNAQVIHLGSGKIVLAFCGLNFDDRAVAFAATKTVPGVTSISTEST